MTQSTRITIGMDLSDRKADICVFDGAQVLQETRVELTPDSVRTWLEGWKPCRVAFEIGAHSPWLSRLVSSMGFEVLVANPMKFRMICDSYRKDDRTDAEVLARTAHMDPVLLSPVEHRTEDTQRALTLVRSRAALVRARTTLINSARGLYKALGGRFSPCAASAFHHRRDEIPEDMLGAFEPLFDAIEGITLQILDLDKAVVRTLEQERSDANILLTIPGVGPLTALTYVLTLESPDRFENARDVGSYLGLTPARRQSGDSERETHISKHGDIALRWMLVQCAHYILGPHGPDSALRTWGLKLAQKPGSASKKRAICAVARKLATVMFTLWTKQVAFEPSPSTAQLAA